MYALLEFDNCIIIQQTEFSKTKYFLEKEKEVDDDEIDFF